MNEEVRLPRILVNQLLHQAQNSPDQEICGLIGARFGAPSSCYPVSNISENPQRLFLMDPKDQIEAMRRIREQREELFAIYHSHPTSPAIPSTTDISLAAYPETLQIIISLNTRGVLEMRGFRLADNAQVSEVALILELD